MAPIHIHPLLEIHCFPRRADQHYVNTEPTRDRVLQELRDMGLIAVKKVAEERDSVYEVTAKGEAYIKELLATPLPEVTYTFRRETKSGRSLFEEVFGRGFNW
jgi:DNA-binding PadR family transcriptional regulator